MEQPTAESVHGQHQRTLRTTRIHFEGSSECTSARDLATGCQMGSRDRGALDRGKKERASRCTLTLWWRKANRFVLSLAEPLLYDDPPTSYLSSTHLQVSHRQMLSVVLACPRHKERLCSSHQLLLILLRSAQSEALASLNNNARGVGTDLYLRKHTAQGRPDKARRSPELLFGPQIVSHRQASEPWRLWWPTDGTHHQRRKKTIPQQEAKLPSNYERDPRENHGGGASFNHGPQCGYYLQDSLGRLHENRGVGVHSGWCK